MRWVDFIVGACCAGAVAAGSGLVRAQAKENDRSREQAAAPVTNLNPFQLGGYVEALYQWNFNSPSNGITNYRGFDNRHNTFTVSNIALDVQWITRTYWGA
jgi:hypothetical protein